MGVYRNSEDYFYYKLQDKQEQISLLWPNIDSIKNTQFYELCQKYSDIALNSDKTRIPGTCNVQGCFHSADIAKQATKDYVEKWAIKNVDVLLELIHKLHSYAVDWDDERATTERVLPEKYDYQSMYGGMLFDFRKLPEDKWKEVAQEVKEYICN